jgi:hypothetical protein
MNSSKITLASLFILIILIGVRAIPVQAKEWNREKSGAIAESPTHFRPHWYQKGPLGNAERSIKIMAMPWKDWRLASAHYLVLAGGIADARTTQNALRNCSGCGETNFLFGSKPSSFRLYGEYIGISLFTEHAAIEWLGDNRENENKSRAAMWATAGGLTAFHSWAAHHNAGIQPTIE